MKREFADATIIYDGACGLCGRLFRRYGSIFHRRGMRTIPLQDSAAMEIANASREQLQTQLHVVMQDGKLVGGIDAVLIIASAFMLLRPIVALARMRWMHVMLDHAYRFIARHRYRVFGTCSIRPTTTRKTALVGWLPLVIAPVLAVCFTRTPSIMMIALAIAIYFGFKWLTWWRSMRDPSIARHLAYLLLWPGMDADRFLGPRKSCETTFANQLTAALGKMLLGAALIWIVARFIPIDHQLLHAWCGMIGLAMLLHFGIFDLISIAWRSRGIDAKPVMRNPARANSLGDFWGRRWNTAFRTLSHDLFYEPARRKFGATIALIATFLASGLVHDAVISIPARGGYGLPTLYFLIQCAGLFIERSRIARRIGLSRGVRGWLFTMLITIVPIPLLFHRPFIHRVMLPILAAISGTWTPGARAIEIMLIIAGVLHLCITSAGVVMTLVLDWRKNLSALSGLTRHIIWTHGSFVLFTIVGFGAISLLQPASLASGAPLARAICAFIAIFWLARLFIQFFLFDARPYLTSNLLSLGYHGLTLVFSFFVLTYGLAAIR